MKKLHNAHQEKLMQDRKTKVNKQKKSFQCVERLF